MHKCKNIECSNEILKGIYCNLTCRNIYINKYERDYTKYKETIANKEAIKLDKYLSNPKKCKGCNTIIDYYKRRNSFCNSSCSASYNNLGKIKSEETKSKISNKNNKGKDIRICKKCSKEFSRNNRGTNSIYCSVECKLILPKEFKEIDSLNEYRSRCKFKFNLNEYPDYFEFNLIEKYGWYSPSNSKSPNLNGVSRDHIFSVSEGYKQCIDPEIIAHPANCRLMRHSDNISKLNKCDILLEDLLNNIDSWGRSSSW